MIDFGLDPCPLCGGKAEVEQLAQSEERLDAVIKCSVCGLTLAWETEIKVGISRSGKRTPVKAGLDPIEAWNRRDCSDCGHKFHSDRVKELPSCNDCGKRRNCEYEPNIGEYCRINCPHWVAREG